MFRTQGNKFCFENFPRDYAESNGVAVGTGAVCAAMTSLAMRKTLIFIVILFLIIAAMFALVLVVPILHIG